MAYQDDQNFRANRGLCTSDSRHRLSLSWVYDLPFGRGRRFLHSATRLTDAFLGGWQLNGILTLRTGQPFTVTVPGDPSNTSDGPTFADLVGNPNDVSDRSVDRFFNVDAFARPDNFRWGTSGRNVVTGPGVNNWDVSFFKNFNMDEVRKIQFRAEFFNFFNHPQFTLPGASFRHRPVREAEQHVEGPARRPVVAEVSFLITGGSAPGHAVAAGRGRRPHLLN